MLGTNVCSDGWREGGEERVITRAFFAEAANGDGVVDHECPAHVSQEFGGLRTTWRGMGPRGGVGATPQNPARTHMCTIAMDNGGR